jgi:hypothetical protein
MAVRCRCSGCGANYQVSDELGGRKVRCKKCATIIEIPAGDEAKAGPAAKAEPAAASPKKPSLVKATPLEDGNASSPVARREAPAKKPLPVEAEAATKAAWDDSPGATTSSASFATRRPGKSRKKETEKGARKSVWAAAMVAGAALVMAPMIYIRMTQERAVASAENTEEESAFIVLDIPNHLRPGTTVMIDGQGRALPLVGPAKYAVTASEHSVTVLRETHREVFSLTLKPQESKSLTPQLPEGTSQVPFLVIDWPESQRGGSLVTIDGKEQIVPATGEVKYPFRKARISMRWCSRGRDSSG